MDTLENTLAMQVLKEKKALFRIKAERNILEGWYRNKVTACIIMCECH